MANRTRLTVAAVAACFAALAAAAPAEARVVRRVYAPVVRPYPYRLPAWDWRRIYPWSPYNYGRNPYNPIIVPYPPPYYPPYPPPAYGIDNAAAADGAVLLTSASQQVLMPHPSGEVRTPPPDAAVVQVRVPDASAHVLFDGERTYTAGTTRYFVTPDLPEGKYHYTLSASWAQGGDTVTKERDIEVTAGHTTVVDFARPAAK